MSALPELTPHGCAHCGAALESPEERFCCTGCEVARGIVEGAGLERYYQLRDQTAPRPSGERGDWSSWPVETAPDGTAQVRFRIDGFRCAACAWVCEELVAHHPHVRQAHVSFASGRAALRWDPTQTNLDELLGPLVAIGYTPRTIDAPLRTDRDLLLRLGFATFAAANVMMVVVPTYLGWLSGLEPRFLALFRWTELLLAAPTALWAAAPLHQAAWAGLRAKRISMDLPVSIGILVMLLHGVGATLLGQDAYLDSLTMLVAALLAGRMLEARGRTQAAEAALALGARLPSRVRRERADGGVEVIDVSALRVGDRVYAATGEELGADGVVLSGSAVVRAALLTGEAEPVAKAVDDPVQAGTLVESGALVVRVTAAAGERLVDRMQRHLHEAVSTPSLPTLAERVAPAFTAGVLAFAVLGFGTWAAQGEPAKGLWVAITVLVVTCPCALALAGPLSTAVGLGTCAKSGLLLKSGDALRDLAQVDTLVLDKTGTLSVGQPRVTEATPEVLRVAAGLERFSVHPIARAIVEAALERRIALPAATQVREQVGQGVSGWVDGVHWTLGRGGPNQVEVQGLGSITLQDQLRPDAARLLHQAHAQGLRTLVLTGDRLATAEALLRGLPVDELHAEVDPEAKLALVEALESRGHRTLVVGDGLNDGPALARATVGVAMAEGAASSILAAKGLLAGGRLGSLTVGLAVARATVASTRRSTWRSLGYNATVLVWALLGWMNPLVAALLMPLSSLAVVAGTGSIRKAAKHAEPQVSRAARPDDGAHP